MACLKKFAFRNPPLIVPLCPLVILLSIESSQIHRPPSSDPYRIPSSPSIVPLTPWFLSQVTLENRVTNSQALPCLIAPVHPFLLSPIKTGVDGLNYSWTFQADVDLTQPVLTISYKFSIAFSLRALIIRSLHSSNPIFQVCVQSDTLSP